MLQRIRHWLRALFRPGAVEREMQDEMHRHLDLSTERYIARGLPPQKARYAARREFGVLGPLQEEARDSRGARWADTVRRDIAHAWRTLVASPAFTTVAVLSLAIGIGANTAIFSLIDAVLLKTLPVTRPDELTVLHIKDPADLSKEGSVVFTNPMWEQIRDRTADDASYAVVGGTSFNLASSGEARPADGLYVNGDFFHTLGLQPAAGRLLATGDDYRGCPGVVVASYGFWQSELGGRRDAVGRTILLSSQPYTLVGVLQPGFTGIDVGASTQLYAPICVEAYAKGTASTLDRRSTWWMRAMARPRPGLSVAELNQRLKLASRQIFESTVPPNWDDASRKDYLTEFIAATPTSNGFSRLRTQYSEALWVLMAMVGVILIISCANVANLLLARGAARSREMAIRVAIGASRARLMGQFLAESMLLAAGGGLLGVWLAMWGSRLLVGILGSSRTPISLDLAMDWRLMAFTAAVSIATVALFGVAPAWRATLVDPQSAMKVGGRGNIEGHSRFRIGKALVVAQSGLALVLVVGAGLLTATFRHLATTDTGFKPEGVLIVKVDFKQSPDHLRARQQLLERFRAIPGVRSASLTDLTPVSGSTWNEMIVVDGFTPAGAEDNLVWFNKVSDDYFKTLGTRLIAGRDFGAQDTPASASVAIVNKVIVDKFFHGKTPIGKTYRTTEQGRLGPPVTIVGVADVAKYSTLREPAQPIVYVASLQDSTIGGSASFLLNASTSPTALIAAVKAAAASVDSRSSLTFRTLSDQLAAALQRERVLAVLSGFFGALALVLAMIGLYGVMAYTVARRRVEIGIRIALGAVRGRVVQLVLGDVAVLIACGIVIGAAGAYAATRMLASFLFEVTPTDPTTLLVAAGILAAAALIAGAIPAGSAARLEPVEALRED